MPSTLRSPRWYAIPVRVLLMTFIGTLMVFAITLMFGIVGTIAVSAWRHVNANMRVAYRQIALPAAVIAGSIIFVLALGMEIRHYRQSRTLAAIARMN